MNNQDESSNWATKDFTIPLLLSGVFSVVICTVLCTVIYLSRDFISNDIAPRLGLIKPTPTSTPIPVPISCPAIPTGWELVMNNNFNTNRYGWPVGKATDAYADTDLQVIDGLLRYNIKAHQGVYYPQTPGINKAPVNFYVTTQARKVSGPQDAQYGLTFLINGNQVLFYTIQDSGRVKVDVLDTEGNWQDPLFNGYSENIKVGESNELVIFRQGSHYTFCVNQYITREINNTDYSFGKFGLGVVLENANDEGIFEFDDFIIYAPAE